MTKDLKDYMPAFPVSTIDGYTQYGMTQRDYFAAKAMQGMLSRDSYQGGWCPKSEGSTQEDGVKRVARFAYEYADAMLEQKESDNG